MFKSIEAFALAVMLAVPMSQIASGSSVYQGEVIRKGFKYRYRGYSPQIHAGTIQQVPAFAF